MPTIVRKEDVSVSGQGPGWKVITLADSTAIGEPAMVARRWNFDPGAEGPETLHGDQDQLLYVIRGSGRAIVDGQTFELDHESVLWLEPGETYHFLAGDDGLEILQGYAPGE
jgi:quercetin dioxygenase-like cupin family protein